MNQKVIYSMMGLAALPMGASAALVQAHSFNWNGTGATVSEGVISSTGQKIEYTIPLKKGTYKFDDFKLTSKVYNVTVELYNVTKNKSIQKIENITGNKQDVSLDEFTLAEASEVKIIFTSDAPASAVGAGAEYSFDELKLNLDFDFDGARGTLTTNVNSLIATLEGYTYAREEDVNAAKAIRDTKIKAIKDSYSDYENYELYKTTNTLQKEIDEIAASAAVTEEVMSRKQYSHDATVALQNKLVDAAAYLLPAAEAEMKEINDRINAAYNANLASYNAGSAATDQATNLNLLPTEAAIDEIKDKYIGTNGSGTITQNAYNALKEKYDDLQAVLNAIKISSTISGSYNKTAAQNAINDLKALADGVKNTVNQESLASKEEWTQAVTKANTEVYNLKNANDNAGVYDADIKAIAQLQKTLDDAKKVVYGYKYGTESLEKYYATRVADIQKKIDDAKTTADQRFNACKKETAGSYVKVTMPNIATPANDIKADSKAASDRYKAVQEEIAKYDKALKEARDAFKDEAIYTAEGDDYDFYTKLNLEQKKIDEIKTAVENALKEAETLSEKKHTAAMKALPTDGSILTNIAGYMAEKDAKVAKYDGEQANGSYDTSVTTFNEAKGEFETAYPKFSASTDAPVYAAKKTDIESAFATANTTAGTAKAAIGAAAYDLDYTGKVGTSDANWAVGAIGHSGATPRTPADGKFGSMQMIDQWKPSTDNTTGTALVQKLSGLPNGVYTINLYASAVDQSSGNPNKDKTDIAFVYANGVEVPVKVTTAAANNVYTLANVPVTDGTLEMGLKKKKAGSNWHLIQIKSMTADATSILNGMAGTVNELTTEMAALTALAKTVAADVQKNGDDKTTLGTNIDNLQKQIDDTQALYKIGQDASTLGLRGKTGGTAEKKETKIESDVNALETSKNGVKVTDFVAENSTALVKTGASDWVRGVLPHTGSASATTDVQGVTMVEQWNSAPGPATTGKLLSQSLTNLPNGVYDIELYANAVDQQANNPNNGKTDIAYVYAEAANSVKKAVTVTSSAGLSTYKLEGVLVIDGTLEIGLAREKSGTNWHTIQIKSMTYHKTSNIFAQLNETYTNLNGQQAAFEKEAIQINKEWTANNDTKAAADGALTGLATYEKTELGALTMTDANGDWDAAAATKNVPAGYTFVVFKTPKTGDSSFKNYETRKSAIDTEIAELTQAIKEAFDAETLTAKWINNDQISVTKKVSGKDVTTVYSIAAIKGKIDALKIDGKAESDNYDAYLEVYTYSFTTCKPEDLVVDAAKVGADAVAYYEGLKAKYSTEKATILANMKKSLEGRKAVADKTSFETSLANLKKKVEAFNAESEANLAKYQEQDAALKATRKLYNEVYNDILVNDNSTMRDEYLKQLEAIETANIKPAEASKTTKGSVLYNYVNGIAVSAAIDFAAINNKINTVKAQQSEGYKEQITADNAVSHQTFMTAIQQATQAYTAAMSARQDYSTSNDEIAQAIYNAAPTFDKAITDTKAAIDQLTADEGQAYAATVSPNVYSSTPFCDDALKIEQDITKAKNDFLEVVDQAIKDFWAAKKGNKSTYGTYAYKLEVATTEIAGYTNETVKKNAFKDVKKLITNGDNAMKAMDIRGVEKAIDGLANIDAMLAADKKEAANKDIIAETPDHAAKIAALTGNAEYGAYVRKSDLNLLNSDAEDVAAAEEDRAASYAAGTIVADHDYIIAAMNTYNAHYEQAIQNAKDDKAADVANTEAYEALLKTLKPVTEKYEKAMSLAEQYKYQTNIDYLESYYRWVVNEIETAKNNGLADDNKSSLEGDIADLSYEIEWQMRNAMFPFEKSSLSADITTLTNLYNNYVKNHGVDATATQYKKEIDALETRRSEIAVKDVDDPANGIKWNDIVACTELLIALQEDIANLQTTMGMDNAGALATLNAGFEKLEAKATLEGKAEWVTSKAYDADQTYAEWMAAIQKSIAEMKAAANAEPNIAFFQNEYQNAIDAIESDLDATLVTVNNWQKQYDDNEAAYNEWTAKLDELQASLNAAVEKVSAYEYANGTYYYLIDNEDPTITSNAQGWIDECRERLDSYNANKTAQYYSYDWFTNNISNYIQRYLDWSARDELNAQVNTLKTNRSNAIIKGNTYSKTLRNRLVAIKASIGEKIDILSEAIEYSATVNDYNGKDDFGYKNWIYEYFDKDDNPISEAEYNPGNGDYAVNKWKGITSDSDYAAQIATVAAIQAEIDALAEAIDNTRFLGDANTDGKVNVLDYQKITNMILDPSLQPDPVEDEELFLNIDINENTVIEVGDLTALVNYIVYKDWGSYAGAAGVKGEVTGEHLSMIASELEPGVKRFAINLENVYDYTAFQLDMVLPNGMTLVRASLSERAGESHKLMSRVQQDGSIRLLASSIKGESFSGNEGAVLYIDVKCAANSGNIELMNILFSSLNDGTRSFNINGEATGISLMSTLEAMKQKVYDLSGRLTNGLKKGINIIRRADGKTQKVIK